MSGKLNPRCQRQNRNGVFVDVDGQWKPCTYVQSSHMWEMMKEWFIENGYNPDELNVANMTHKEYHECDAFKALHASFKTENYPKCCPLECADGAWLSNNDTNKWSPYK